MSHPVYEIEFVYPGRGSSVYFAFDAEHANDMINDQADAIWFEYPATNLDPSDIVHGQIRKFLPDGKQTVVFDSKKKIFDIQDAMVRKLYTFKQKETPMKNLDGKVDGFKTIGLFEEMGSGSSKNELHGRFVHLQPFEKNYNPKKYRLNKEMNYYIVSGPFSELCNISDSDYGDVRVDLPKDEKEIKITPYKR